MERCLVCTIGLTRTRSAGAATTRAPTRTGSQPAHGAAAYASWMTGPVPHDRVALLVNGSSRRGADAYGRTLRGLRSAGLAVMRSVLLEDPAQLPAEVAAAVGATCRLLVVGGGDGTVGAVAGLLADLPPEVRPVLGVVPLGTANDFARTLDLQPGVVAALTALATGKVVDVDLGRANGAPFVKFGSVQLGYLAEFAQGKLGEFDIRAQSIASHASNLSGGNQQKVVLARELSRELRLFVAAQPTRGLDVGSIEFVHSQIVATRDAGLPVIVVSTELDEVTALADRIAVMYRGTIVGIVPGNTPRDVLGLMMAGELPAGTELAA